MAAGGVRQGAPGKNYTNRSDMQAGPRAQPVRAASGQAYGERKEQEDAQRALPLPGELGAFTRPTERPNEPLTAGMAQGPGPGPEVLTMATAGGTDDVLAALRAAYQLYPSDDLMDLLIAEQLR